MIALTFMQDRDLCVIKIQGKSVYFAKNSGVNAQMSTIDGLRLNPASIVKEFPDLKGKPIEEIKHEGIIRFKEHILKMKTEVDIRNYIISDLKKYGFKLIMENRPGFRTKIYKENK